MIIKEITVNNFRQFYGLQSIDLSPSGKSDNVCVIYGANGRGKTGLYRALMFCLYGERILAQDPDDCKEIHLINELALDSESKNNKEATAYVEVRFVHKDVEFKLKRSLLGIKKSDNTYEQLGEVVLTTKLNDGNSHVTRDSNEIEKTINSILDKRLREYFLFDGEKIERLTRATRSQKQEVQIGIKNLLNIDRLFLAGSSLDLLMKSLDKQLKNRSEGNYKRMLIELEQKEKCLDKLNTQKDQQLSELRNAEQISKDIDEQLKKYESISRYLKDREKISAKLKREIEDKQELCNRIITVNDEIALILIDSDLEDVEGILKNKIDNHELPSQIRESVVEKILAERLCICGNPIAKGTEAYNSILKWRDKVIDAQVEQGLMGTFRDIGSARERARHKLEQVESCLQEFSVKTENIERYEESLQRISDEIGEQKVDENIPMLEKQRADTIKKIGILENALANTTKNIDECDIEIRNMRVGLKELARKEGLRNSLMKRCEVAADSIDALRQIQKEFIDEIKEKISMHATVIFHKLIDQDGARIFKDIKVADDYSIQLYDCRDKPFLANISAGQRQITSIAFITALAQIAGGSDILEVPLFMDTPFGRLSGEHRDNIISNVPNLSKQWILLATDTEFGSEEVKKLRQTHKWSKLYVLEGTKPYHTLIKEVNVDSFTPSRAS